MSGSNPQKPRLIKEETQHQEPVTFHHRRCHHLLPSHYARDDDRSLHSPDLECTD
jgi:hypothetical protein